MGLPFIEEYLYCLEHPGSHPPLDGMPAYVKDHWMLYWRTRKKLQAWRAAPGAPQRLIGG